MEDSLENAVSLWNNELIIPLLTSLKLAPGTAEYVQLTNTLSSSYSEEHNPSGIPLYKPSYPTAEKILRCSHCEAIFKTREEQVLHYSLDWHRLNLKRSMEGASPVTHEHFIHGTWPEQEPAEDQDSDGGSEEEESSEEESVEIKKKPRVFLVNTDNELISIYRTVLQHKKDVFSTENELVSRVNSSRHKNYWLIILAGGGHFAAAVFKGPDVIAHKTFHSYTVRAKQGGSQSSRDNRNATSHPRSAGASLRRYNEQVYNQHVQELMTEWKEHLSLCHLIFCRCPKSNSPLLFGGPSPMLLKLDHRLRTIPFPSKKPSFAEVKKIHRTLSQIYLHGPLKDVVEFDKEKSLHKKSGSPGQSVAPRGEKESKKLGKDELAGIDTHEVALLGKSSSEDDFTELTTSFCTISTTPLQSYGSSVEEERAKKKRLTKKKKKTDSDNKKSGSVNANESRDSTPERRKVENFVYTACRTGNLYELEALLHFSTQRDLTELSDVLPNDVVEAVLSLGPRFDFLAIRFGVPNKALLHVAAENAQNNVIWWLLDEGCDPCVKNLKSETPYMACKVKEARNHFRRYMAVHPVKYNYVKANIPGPLTKEDEAQQKSKLVEKKRQQKKNKQEKEKERKDELDRKKKEEAEKEKYLRLSDREKRALAAEKRMQASRDEERNKLVARCFQCAKDLGTAVPFEYSDFKFCSTLCVREHRNKSKNT